MWSAFTGSPSPFATYSPSLCPLTHPCTRCQPKRSNPPPSNLTQEGHPPQLPKDPNLRLVLVFFRMHARPPQRFKIRHFSNPPTIVPCTERRAGQGNRVSPAVMAPAREHTREPMSLAPVPPRGSHLFCLSKRVKTRNLHLKGKHQQRSAWARRAFCPFQDKVSPDRLTWSSKSVAADPRARVARSKPHVLQDVKTSMWLPGDSRKHDSDTCRLSRLCGAAGCWHTRGWTVHAVLRPRTRTAQFPESSAHARTTW